MTMQQASAPAPAPAAPAAAPAPSAPERSTTEARADALRAKLDESPSESSESAGAPEGAAPAAAPAGADDAGARARAERRERIDVARAKERAADVERRKHAQKTQQERANTTELETLRAKLKELEPLNNTFTSKDSFLAEAERRGFTAKEMIDHWREKLTDPQAIAARHAQTVEEKLRAEIQALQKRLDDDVASRTQETEKQRALREAQEGASEFATQTKAKAASHPMTAAFLERHGEAGYITFVNHSIVPLFPNGYNLDELHDYAEEYIERVQLNGASPTPATPVNGISQPPPKNGAEQPPTTLGNSHGSERTTVQEEIPSRQLTLEQRAERLKAQLGSE